MYILQSEWRVSRSFEILCISLVLISCQKKAAYLLQAAEGQLRLSTEGQPVEDAARDETLPRYVRGLMAEVPDIRKFITSHGLNVSKNYSRYVHLRRPAVVWFVGASPEFSLKPLTWKFPIVGSFPGLGFFNYAEGIKWRNYLAAKGHDVQIRAVPAFSTGGWFADPVVSTMLYQGRNRYGALVNVLIHESVHATVLVPSQSFFNESIATYIGDGMTASYLTEHFGEDSPITKLYTKREKHSGKRVNKMGDAYEELKKLYASGASKVEMRKKKKVILDKLDREMKLWYRPNNATLSGHKTYRSGKTGFDELFSRCGKDWNRFIAAAKTIKKADFPKKQTDELKPVLDKVVCPTIK